MPSLPSGTSPFERTVWPTMGLIVAAGSMRNAGIGRSRGFPCIVWRQAGLARQASAAAVATGPDLPSLLYALLPALPGGGAPGLGQRQTGQGGMRTVAAADDP